MKHLSSQIFDVPDDRVGRFPIAPRFMEDEQGVPICYEDGSPTLTSIINYLNDQREDTRKFNDVVVIGAMAVPRIDLTDREYKKQPKSKVVPVPFEEDDYF